MTRTAAPSALLLALVLSQPTAALAQPTAAPAQAAGPTGPAFRVDVTAQGDFGVATDASGPLYGADLSVTAAHRSGHGGRLAIGFAGADAPAGIRLSLLLDGGYVHRIHLEGDDRLGLALDLDAGLSAGLISEGGFWSSSDEGGVADGWHLGGTAGASLDFRATAFVVGLHARGHVLGALEGDAARSAVQADLSVGLHLGFGFY